jgi:methyltransferase
MMPSATVVAVPVLAYATLQRLWDAVFGQRNAARLLASGAVEHGRGHYPLIVALHSAWLAALWLALPVREISLPALFGFTALQGLRFWIIASLGARWSTRILVLPGAPLVRSGPYRWLDHPNYMVVALEMPVLPLVFGLTGVASAFALLNALVLVFRIRAEDRALGRR